MLWFVLSAALAQETPMCSAYWEREVGILEGEPVTAAACTQNMQLHGHRGVGLAFSRGAHDGPILDFVSNEGKASYRDIELVDGGVRFRMVRHWNPHTYIFGTSVWFARWNEDLGEFEQAKKLADEVPKQTEMVALIAKGDRLGAWAIARTLPGASEGVCALPQDWWLSMQQRAAQAYRNGNKGEAADVLLGWFATDDACFYGDYAAPPPIEAANDVGFFLDQGGHHKEGIDVLRNVVEQAAGTRPVAELNLADALWATGDREALTWYSNYAKAAKNPVKRASERNYTPPDPKPANHAAAEARYLRHLEQGDFEAAKGAAAAANLDLRTRQDWWTRGTAEVVRLAGTGQHERAEGLVAWMGPATRDGTLQTLLEETVVQLAESGGVPGTGGWIASSDRPMVIRALKRNGSWRLALSMAPDERAPVSLRTVDDDLCALVRSSTRTQWACTGDRKPSYEEMTEPLRNPFGNELAYPTFTPWQWSRPGKPNLAAFNENPEGHICGLDGFGRVFCLGSDAVARGQHPPEEGFVRLDTTATHACALHDSGFSSCWGELGEMPRRISDSVDMAVGPGWTCSLGDDATMTCFGAAPVLELPEPPEWLEPGDVARLRK
jgi:hypothetical protein